MILVLPLLAWGIWRRSQDVIRAALSVLVVLAVTAITVFFTGEPAEELVEHLAGISEAVIEPHEKAALFATIALGVTGALALTGLFVFRHRTIPLRIAAVLLILSLVPAGALAWTAYLGGQIRHSEIRIEAEVDAQLGGAEAGAILLIP